MTATAIKALALIGADLEANDSRPLKFSEQLIVDEAEYAEKMLTERYPDVVCELIGINRRGLMRSYNEFRYAMAGESRGEFVVRITCDNQQYSYAESLYCIIHEGEYEGIADSAVAACEQIRKVYSTITGYVGKNADMAMPVDKAIIANNLTAYNWVILSESDTGFNDRVEEIKRIVTDKALYGDYMVIELKNEEYRSIANKTEAFEKIPKYMKTSIYARFAVKKEA